MRIAVMSEQLWDTQAEKVTSKLARKEEPAQNFRLYSEVVY